MSLILDHSSKGFYLVPDTNPVAKSFYGFTVLATSSLSNIAAPTSTVNGGPEKYQGNYADLVGVGFPPGYYPIRGSSITASIGDVIILWLE